MARVASFSLLLAKAVLIVALLILLPLFVADLLGYHLTSDSRPHQRHVEVLRPDAVGVWVGESGPLVVRMQLDEKACGYFAVCSDRGIYETYAVRGVYFTYLPWLEREGDAFSVFLLGPVQDTAPLIRLGGEASRGRVTIERVVPDAFWWQPGQQLELRPSHVVESHTQAKLRANIELASQTDTIGWADRGILDTGYLPADNYLRRRGLIRGGTTAATDVREGAR